AGCLDQAEVPTLGGQQAAGRWSPGLDPVAEDPVAERGGCRDDAFERLPQVRFQFREACARADADLERPAAHLCEAEPPLGADARQERPARAVDVVNGTAARAFEEHRP